jgi:hypothetical protein
MYSQLPRQKGFFNLLDIRLIILNPIIRYGLFDSAHQTLTLLTFAGSLYFLTTKTL